MKNFQIIVCIAITILGANSYAQEKKMADSQKEELKVRLEEYFAKLALTEEQKVSYEEITKRQGEQIKLIKESGLSREEKLSEIRRIQSDKDNELKVLLTEEQYQFYLENKRQQRNNLLENHEGEFAEYLERLELSEEQRPQYIEISKRYGEQLKQLKNSSKSRLSKYRAYKSIQKNKNAEMKSLLSKEQYKVYEEIQEEVQKKIKEKRNQ